MCRDNIAQNIFRALSSNGIGIIASVFIILVLPKFIGLEEYSYWQLYVFYASYVGFLHLGWSDGFYLINGGKNTSDLNREKTSANYYCFILFQLLLASIVLVFSFSLQGDYSKVAFYISICLFLTNIRSYSQFLLQATSRFKEYSNIIILEKLTLVFGVLLVMLFCDVTFEMIILIDIFSRLIALVVSSFLCKDILCFSTVSYQTLLCGLPDTRMYISSGFKLMFSFICGLLIFGLVRFTIEEKWGVLVFGEVSLTLSLATLFVIFINSISIVLFPILRNLTKELRGEIYTKIRLFLLLFLLILCNGYFPLHSFISVWLPDFSRALVYLPLVFPIMLFETKTSILTNSYFKALRKESDLLKVNFGTLVISTLFCSVSYYYFESVENCLIFLVVLSFIRYVVSDYLLSKMMKTTKISFWVLDVIFVFLFVALSRSNYSYLYTIISLPLIPILIYKISKFRT